MLNPEIQSLFLILPFFIGIGTIVLWIMIVFIKLCSSALDEVLAKNKTICTECSRVHKRDFVFASLPFCSFECWQKFGSELSAEDLIKLDEIDKSNR